MGDVCLCTLWSRVQVFDGAAWSLSHVYIVIATCHAQALYTSFWCERNIGLNDVDSGVTQLRMASTLWGGISYRISTIVFDMTCLYNLSSCLI